MKKLLLHICCAPCAIYPFETLTKAGFSVEGLFYNPNIQPIAEHSKRREAVGDFEKVFGVKLHSVDHPEDIYHQHTKTAKDRGSRCRSCFKLRLKETHRFALDNKFDFFSTTLLVSPYQDQRTIKELGEEISLNSDSQFLFCDFHPGFREGHKRAKELNFYCQKYCGCLSSLRERDEAKKTKKRKC